LAAGDKGSDFVPTLTLAECCRSIDTFGVEYENDGINNRRTFKYVDRPSEGNAPSQGCPEFIATLHATAVSRGNNDGG
jgi:hypothetical protein